ncbi:MAG: NAD(P)/FAD-dependent oxidoreductase [Alphaproteobacteria bacterium]
MARTRLFSIVKRALNAAGASSKAGASALTRRQMLLLSGAASLAACAPLGLGHGNKQESSIAIVGGGVAGLTVAYRLAQAGKHATIYEASSRFGGRMYTQHNFNSEGMLCELGGELVDTDHAPLISLAKEVGVGIQRLKLEENGGEDIYYLGGRLRSERDMLRHGKGAFLTIAKQISLDQQLLTDANDNWTEQARTLDQMSIAQYLAQFRGRAPDWAIDLLDLAYMGEYGLPTNQQSALNLVDLISAETGAKSGFAMFGKSDEVFRIEGGSQALPDALFAKLGPSVKTQPKFALESIGRNRAAFSLVFSTPAGRAKATHEIVVMALPFTRLRDVAGIDAIGLDATKLKCIKELGYGDNAKVMVGTTSRPWADGTAKLPVKSDGEFYSKDFQVVWDTSRGQEGKRGILTNFLSGVEEESQALASMQSGLRQISPAIADSLDPSNIASFFWAKHPHTRGSYASAKVGQYTTLLEVAATPAFDGALQFAGEHTSADFLGFMRGGVDSGERVAKALLTPGKQASEPSPFRERAG